MAKKFEEALDELQDIVAILDKGEAPLDESMKLFEKGIALSGYCKKLLDEAEEKVHQVAYDGKEYDYDEEVLNYELMDVVDLNVRKPGDL